MFWSALLAVGVIISLVDEAALHMALVRLRTGAFSARRGISVTFLSWLEAFLERNGGRLRGFALRRSEASEDARDLLQDILLRSVEVGGRAPQSDQHRIGWLYTIGKNVSLERRKKSNRDSVLSPLPEKGLPDDRGESSAEFDQSSLWRIIATLPKEYRDAFVLADLERLTYGAIGQQLRCAPSTACKRAQRARSVIQAALDWGKVTGVVRSPDGKPLQGARVRIRGDKVPLTREVRTSKGGAFTLPLIPPGEYWLTVQTEGFRPYRAAATTGSKVLNIEVSLRQVNADED